jgi:hypothetical protein
MRNGRWPCLGGQSKHGRQHKESPAGVQRGSRVNAAVWSLGAFMLLARCAARPPQLVHPDQGDSSKLPSTAGGGREAGQSGLRAR